jgi:hypothetical protein
MTTYPHQETGENADFGYATDLSNHEVAENLINYVLAKALDNVKSSHAKNRTSVFTTKFWFEVEFPFAFVKNEEQLGDPPILADAPSKSLESFGNLKDCVELLNILKVDPNKEPALHNWIMRSLYTGGSFNLCCKPSFSGPFILPPGWFASRDTKTDRIYYFNKSKNISQWQHPCTKSVLEVQSNTHH